MSHPITIRRHHLIINKLRKQNQATFSEISDYLNRESEILGENLTISKRTFNRDVAAIAEVYGIYIKYDFSAQAYSIEEDLSNESQNRFLEAFDIFNALKIKERQENHIFLDNRKSTGTEKLYDLLRAINNQFQVSFHYKTFQYGNTIERTVNPLAIKEFKYRWYLFGQDISNGEIKTYGLDRMFNLKISNTNFEAPNDFNLKEDYKFCFGIVGPNANEPTDIILFFEPLNGEYIKTLPLHHTQQILQDNNSGLQISLRLYLTHDFIMELLSFGDSVKVVKPQELIDTLKSVYQKARDNYDVV